MINKEIKQPTDLKGSFNHPEELVENLETAKRWQFANKSFWEKNSMRYDWDKSIPYAEFSREFYLEIDNRFLNATYQVMPWEKVPFEKWMESSSLPERDVLEIGVGNGTHAQLLATSAKSYTGIDLTEYAVRSTRSRFELNKIHGTILQMDAEKLHFPSMSFDFVWSWGVIHHSSDTGKILNEIHRVLKPGGKTTLMVYYRSWWSYYIAGFLLGLFKGYFFKGMTLHQINQSRTDGALARYYTFNSWRRLAQNHFLITRLETLGNKGDIIPIPGSRFKSILLNLIPTWLAIFYLKNLRMGSFLICEMEKK